MSEPMEVNFATLIEEYNQFFGPLYGPSLIQAFTKLAKTSTPEEDDGHRASDLYNLIADIVRPIKTAYGNLSEAKQGLQDRVEELKKDTAFSRGQLEKSERQLEKSETRLQHEEEKYNQRFENILELTKKLAISETERNILQRQLDQARDHIFFLENSKTEFKYGKTLGHHGSRTRTQLWDELKSQNQVREISLKFSPTEEDVNNLAAATEMFKTLTRDKKDTWKVEKDMYKDLNELVRKLCPDGSYTIDTHMDHSVDTTIAWSPRIPNALFNIMFVIEWKHPSVSITTGGERGQMIDYLLAIRERLPAQSKFHGILSNFIESAVFEVNFRSDGTYTVQISTTNDLVSAVAYALNQSERKTIEFTLPESYKDNAEIFASTPEHFVAHAPLSNRQHPQVFPEASRVVIKVLSPKADDVSPNNWARVYWNELEMLKKVRQSKSIHIVEYLPDNFPTLVMVPFGRSINDNEASSTLKNAVTGVLAGLKHIHKCDVIHRDLRRSNVVLIQRGDKPQPVIIDFGCATDSWSKEIPYEGSALAVPPRLLLMNEDELYDPLFSDDLFAFILFVQTLLFPLAFVGFNVGRVNPNRDKSKFSSETHRLFQLWGDIKSSPTWGNFYAAACKEDYDSLADMANLFTTMDTTRRGKRSG
ncbi:Serine/threonine protein kinase [Mycena indigotica]|uniref:Serine/threonine protein kinase n=1 Tax=Mycena indigotica TaxID=2126181 RepID=A0A8H6VUW3_9AGAR|nr:Serine/threonine protein kinase [Mycena indigotica]KAF7294809.1 Serine/threonine protein kinase [Mycena indigotica]